MRPRARSMSTRMRRSGAVARRCGEIRCSGGLGGGDPTGGGGSRPSTVSGVVYENRSGGAQRAAGVVKTDAAGRYALPADEESIVRDKGERE
jgi:hypothetical protein